MSREELIIKELKRCDKAYDDGSPFLTDTQYDLLRHELSILNPDSEYLKIPRGNPGTIKLFKPMLSIRNVFEISKLDEFAWECDPFVSPKLDGMAVELLFKEGRLVYAATKGNGYFGEDITDHFKYVNYHDSLTALNKEFFVLRGELVFSKDNFIELNKMDSYVNSRNAVPAICRTKEPDVKKLNLMEFMVWDIYCDKSFSFYKDKLEYINSMGFNAVSGGVGSELRYSKFEAGLDYSFESVVNGFDRDSFKYQIDGLVFRYNDESIFSKGKDTSVAYSGVVAFKWKSKVQVSKIKYIKWSGGAVEFTPIADIEPLIFDGVTVSKVNLNNPEKMLRLGLFTGSTIYVERSGDVIPKAVKGNLIDDQNKDTIMSKVLNELPVVCPYCDHELDVIKMKHVVCSNFDCPRKFIRKMELSFKAGGLKNFGLSTVDSLHAYFESILEYHWSIYFINTVQFYEAFTEGIASNLSVEYLKLYDIDLVSFVDMFQIKSVARSSAAKIAREMQHTASSLGAEGVLDCFINFSEEELLVWINKLPINNPAKEDFKDRASEFLFYIGEWCSKFNDFETSYTKTAGITCCLTGTLSESRSVLKDFYTEKGFNVVSSVSKSVDVLIAQEGFKSSKVTKALKLGIEVLTEYDFNKKYIEEA